MAKIFREKSKGQTLIIGSFIVEFDEEGFGVLEDNEYAETLCHNLPHEYTLVKEPAKVTKPIKVKEPENDKEPIKEPEGNDKEKEEKEKEKDKPPTRRSAKP